MWRSAAVCLLSGSLALAGCSSRASDPPLPCPPKGIGVEHTNLLRTDLAVEPCTWECTFWSEGRFACHEGSNICEQIADYKRFACTAPQICPDVGGKDAQFVRTRAGASTGVEVSFLLTNCSTGASDLHLSGVTVYGDERCSFSDVTDADIAEKTVPPGGTTVIRTVYKPLSAGADYAELRVTSDAQNFPELRLTICGAASPIVDGGAGDGGNLPQTADQCKEQKTVVGCHTKR